jgi:hypothetical protein
VQNEKNDTQRPVLRPQGEAQPVRQSAYL